MPSFSDIAQRLGEMATGFTVGTMEREQADRAEARQLTDTAISRGAQGIDYATFFQPEQFRPATAPVLQQLQQQSGGLTPDTPANVPMLQRPFSENLIRTQTREQEQRTWQENVEERRAQRSEAAQERNLDSLEYRQERRAEEARARARAPQRRSELSSADWHDLNNQINQTVNAGLQALDPEYMTATPRGLAITPRFQGVQSAIVHAVRQRLPDHLPSDQASRGMLIEQIYNDVAHGITRTEAGGHWYTGGYSPSSMIYNEQNAVPRRNYGPAPAATPAAGTAPPPNPGHAARMQRTLEQYGPLIGPAAREFNVPPTLLAAVIGPAEGGSPNAVSAPSARGQRAYGMMQIEPETYQEIARRIGAPTDGIFDPATNIRVGAAYLSDLVQRYRGNYTLALAAYNWGPRHVDRILTQVSAGAPRTDLLQRMPPSTQAYLARVGDALGGWDASGASFVGLTGQAPPNAPPGAAARTVVQTTPTAEHMATMQTLLTRFEQTARLSVQSMTVYSRRQQAKEAAIAQAQIHLRDNYPQFADWAIDQLRTRLRDVH